MRWVPRIAEVLGTLWRMAWPKLRLSRVAVLSFLLGLLLLTVPEQTRAVVAELGDSGGATAAFLVGLFAWAFTLWFWARWALTLECGVDLPEAGKRLGAIERLLGWDKQIPRVLALLAGLLGAFVAARGTGELLSGPVLGAGVVAAAIYGLTWWRRALDDRLRLGRLLLRDEEWQRGVSEQRVALQLAPGGGIPERGRIFGMPEHRLFERYYRGAGVLRRFGFARLSRDLDAAPFGRVPAYALIALALGFCAALWIWPGEFAHVLGAAGMAMLALAALTTLASVAVLFWGRHTGLPSATMLVLGGLLIAGTPANNHEIRRLDPIPAARPTLRDAAGAWLEACGARVAPDATKPLDLVLVGTAGGASRAGLWTTRVLDSLSATDPQFHGRLFGISGVSGGSLGAAVWVASLARDGVDCTQPAAAAAEARTQRHAGFFARDHLAAPIAAFLSTDPVWFGFVPFNLVATVPRMLGATHSWTPPDRAAALERSWEIAWRDLSGGDEMAAPFHALWREGDAWRYRRPLLFLNGTHQRTGLPIVTAPARLDRPDFLASHDFINITAHDVRLSTAATNSARFPYVTPAGGFREAGQGDWLGNLVDGGYFDNQGASTLSDVALALHDVFRARFPERWLRLMVVQVSSDPERRQDELVRCTDLRAAQAGRDPRQQHADAVAALKTDGRNPSGLDAPLAPLLAVAATQAAHTVRTSVNLARVFCSDSPAVRPLPQVEFAYLHFKLCRPGKGQVPPLNWVLPRATRDYIAAEAMAECGNAAELEAYARWLRAPVTTTAAAPAPGR